MRATCPKCKSRLKVRTWPLPPTGTVVAWCPGKILEEITLADGRKRKVATDEPCDWEGEAWRNGTWISVATKRGRWLGQL